jgi:hypothetical protein
VENPLSVTLLLLIILRVILGAINIEVVRILDGVAAVVAVQFSN